MPIIPFLGIVVIALLPAACVLGLGLWARRVRRRAVAPRWAIAVAYGLVVIAVLPVLSGAVWGMSTTLGAQPGEPRDKARMLAEGISEVMNCGAFGLLVAVVGAVWLGFCAWRWRRKPG